MGTFNANLDQSHVQHLGQWQETLTLLHSNELMLRCNEQLQLLVIQFWKSVQVIEQKHKSNYNRLHFLIYLLHILRSISTDFSLLQE